MEVHTSNFSYEVENGELIGTCSCGYKDDGCIVVRNGKDITVTLKAELYATHIYAVRYNDDGYVLEVECVEVTDTVTNISFISDAGAVKIFFLTDNDVPWLKAAAI